MSSSSLSSWVFSVAHKLCCGRILKAVHDSKHVSPKAQSIRPDQDDNDVVPRPVTPKAYDSKYLHVVSCYPAILCLFAFFFFVRSFVHLLSLLVFLSIFYCSACGSSISLSFFFLIELLCFLRCRINLMIFDQLCVTLPRLDGLDTRSWLRLADFLH